MLASGVPLVGLEQDDSTYFDFHHTANDTFDKILPKDLDRAAAAMAVAGLVPGRRARPDLPGSGRPQEAAVVRRVVGIAAWALLGAFRLQAQIDPATADRFAKLALACVDREYPNKPDAVLDAPSDVKPHEGLPSGVLRLLRLALLGARPLDAPSPGAA